MSYLKLYDWPYQELGSKIWYRSFDKNEPISPIRTIPDLGVEFYLIYEGQIQLKTARKAQIFRQSYIRGLVDGFGEFTPTDDFVMIGVRCMPWIAKDLFDLPVSEIYNDRVELRDLNTNIGSLEPKTLSEADIREVVKAIQQTALKKYDGLSKEEYYVRTALQMIVNARGNLRIESISSPLNITPRHLRRIFKNELGCSPKEIGMRIKVRAAIRYYADHHETDMSFLAQHAGFVDRSHFDKSFQNIVGLTPTMYFSTFEKKKFI